METVSETSQNTNPILIKYKNSVYDITNFIGKHPGGSFVFGNVENQNITNIVQTYHKNTKIVEDVLEKYKVEEYGDKQFHGYESDFTLVNFILTQSITS
jgi:cytochrome b involved in lipid metabolism